LKRVLSAEGFIFTGPFFEKTHLAAKYIEKSSNKFVHLFI
jgi:hypothetical protein